MPATPIYALPYPEASDPADVPTDLHELADRIEAVLGAAPGSSFPASPTNGQIAYLQPVAGVIWQFRYNASGGANKWEFIGGPPLASEVTTQQGTPSTTFVDLATVGPQITLPRAGSYAISYSVHASPAGGAWALVATKLGAAAAVEMLQSQVAGEQEIATSAYLITAAAGDLLKLQYRTTAGTCQYSRRRLMAMPVALA